MQTKGFRGLAIWLAIVSLAIALLFPLHSTVFSTTDGKDVIEARPLDVKITNYTDTTITKTEIVPYNSLPTPATFSSSILSNMATIWVVLLVVSILALLLEYFRAEEMDRFNQFALLALLLTMLAVYAFWSTWSAYLTAQYSVGFSQTTATSATGMGIGFLGALFATFLMFVIVLQGYTARSAH